MNEEVIYIIQVKFVYINWVASALLLFFTAHCLVVSSVPACQGFGNFFCTTLFAVGFLQPLVQRADFFLKQGLFVCIFFGVCVVSRYHVSFVFCRCECMQCIVSFNV